MLFRRKRRSIWLALGLMVLLAAVTLSVAFAFPNHSASWLSRPGVGDSSEAGFYYGAITAPATFDAWKTAYGFSGSNDVEAIYYNAGDLGFGREMHCRKNGSGSNYTVACYVVNHGLGAATPVEPALNAAIANQNTLPTVAMVYSRTLDNLANDVAFYIYDPSGSRLNSVPLDSEGDKFTPRMCLACHGGSYNGADSVFDANFLPFDAASFRYSTQTGYTLADQQEKIRQLNALVKDTNPTAQIAELIDGWYAGAGDVNTPGSTFDGNFVASGYASDPGLYNNVFKPFCRSCHIAQLGYPLSAPDQLLAWNASDNLNAGYDVFHVFDMPHAELTSHNFWNSPAPAYLADRGGWSYRVTRLDDKVPDGCQPTDCTLREAIIAANTFGGTAPVYKSIITFAVDGTFTLTRSGANEDLASTGDLDINGGEIIILGNGADKTIIDGGGTDRVFHILGGAITVIQGVTVQNGNAGSGPGGGIENDGSQLTLNNSVVKNNSSDNGAGIKNFNGGITEINDSTLGPNNVAAVSGGGLINNGGTVTLNNSTISGNSASLGGGIYNVNAGSVTTVNQSTITRNSASSASDGGGGVRNIADSIFNVKDSIIAGNVSPGFKDCANSITLPVTFTSQGYNLFGENGSANGCPTTGTDIVLAGSVSTVLNINLSAVGSDGTPHHALVQNGPAVDAIPLGGNCALPSYDQRNAARPEDGNLNGTPACDIGAYELVPRWLIFLPLVVKGQ